MAAVCGVPRASSTMLMFAFFLPEVSGEKVTEIVQDAEIPSVAPHVVVLLKSAAFDPVIEILVMVSVEVPVLVSVRIRAGELDVRTNWLLNVRDDGEMLAIGAPEVGYGYV